MNKKMRSSTTIWAARLFSITIWVSAAVLLFTLVTHVSWVRTIALRPPPEASPLALWAFYLGSLLPIVVWALWTWCYVLARRALRSPHTQTLTLKRLALALAAIFVIDSGSEILTRAAKSTGANFEVRLLDQIVTSNIAEVQVAGEPEEIKKARTDVVRFELSTAIKQGYLLPHTQGTMTLLLAALVFLLARSREEMELVV